MSIGKFKEEKPMVVIKVQYDAYNRQFTLLDRELAHTLEDGETYMLVADVTVNDLEVREPQRCCRPTLSA